MISILGVPFSDKTMAQTVEHLHQHIENGTSLFHVVTANPEIVMNGTRSDSFMNLLQQAEMITPDGIGVVIASRLKGTPLKERVAGYDTVHELLKLREGKGLKTRIYAVGAKPEVIGLAVKKLSSLYQHVEVIGHHHGYFKAGSETEEEIKTSIRAAKPDLLLAGLGCPRQEEFILSLKEGFGAKVAIGCGGTFDVLAGTVKRAPLFYQKAGLEWLYRLAQQPSRWRRQLDLFRFIGKVWKEDRKKL